VAWYQHRVALGVHEEMERHGMIVDDLGLDPVCDAAWLQRKFYGQATANLGEMFEWALALSVEILPVLRTRSDLLPPRGRVRFSKETTG
jgi:hypothetical protein